MEKHTIVSGLKATYPQISSRAPDKPVCLWLGNSWKGCSGSK